MLRSSGMSAAALADKLNRVDPSAAGQLTVTEDTPNEPGLIVTGVSNVNAGGLGVAALRVDTEWNNTGGGWGRGIELNVTGTLFGDNSYLMDLKVGGVSALAVRYLNSGETFFGSNTGALTFFSNVGRVIFGSNGATRWYIETDGALLYWNPAVINHGATTVANIPASHGVGARFMVTDATLSLAAGIGTVVVGGGANIVPVYHDGTNWRIG